MKKIMVTFVGLFFVMAFAASNAAPLMPNGTIVRTNIRLVKNETITGTIINQGTTVSKTMYRSYPAGKIPGADFPAEVGAKCFGRFTLDQESAKKWTDPVFYGDIDGGGGNGVYFQFKVLESGVVDVNYLTQGTAKGDYVSSGMLIGVDFTG